MEKNTTGPTIIFNAFRNIVLTDENILSFNTVLTVSGTKVFISNPTTMAATNASIVCIAIAWGFFCTMISTILV